MPEWLVWTLIAVGVVALLVLLLVLPGRGGSRDRRTNEMVVRHQSESIRNQGSGGGGGGGFF